MSKLQSTRLEVTRALLDCAKAARFRFGEDTAIVAVQHMLCQTVDLFQTVGQMGLDLRNVFCAGKIYSNNPAIIENLRKLGVTIIDTTTPEPAEFHSYFERDIKRLWTVVANSLANRRVNRILVLDDAGVCISNVPQEILRRYAVCGVEQTSRGVFVLERNPPPFAVISWARTAVKLEIGGPIFSQCFMHKLNTEFLHGRPLTRRRVGVIGLGSIGRAVATFAIRQNNEVLFYDPDQDLPVPPSLRRHIARLDSLEELMAHSDYVLGCSGRNPFQDKWPLKHQPNVKLLSASGGDDEFGPIITDLKRLAGFEVKPESWDIASQLGPCGPLHIAYLGYPYNFVSRAPEAVPTRVVQLETGGLLAALVQARMYLELCENGREHNRGIHRLSPRAQRFVYETWLGAMKEKGINLTETFAYDPETLNTARDDRWLINNTEPYHDRHYKPVTSVEEMMAQFLCNGCVMKTSSQAVA